MANYGIIGAGQDTAHRASKKYQIIYADPPWPIKWTNSNTVSGFKRLQYPTMGIAEMCCLRVADLADSGCKCFVWTTNGFLLEALFLVRAWGFQYDKLWTWCKKTGAGGHPRNATEHIVEGTMGFIKTIGMHESATNNWFIAGRSEHSKKPDEARQMIERFYPNSEKIELFAREKSDGWDVWGNEITSTAGIEERIHALRSPVQNTMEICHTAPNNAMLQGLKPHAGNTGTSA